MITRHIGWLAAALLSQALGTTGCSGCGGSSSPIELQQTELVAFTSPDARVWTLQPGVLAEGLSTLGLSVREDGEIWVTGVDHLHPLGFFERRGGPKVRGLRYTGEAWEPHTWSLEGPEEADIIDPQWFGDELWYVAWEGEGDPAHHQQPNQIRSLPGPVSRYEAKGLVDPTPVEFRGQSYLFANIWGRGVIQLAGDPYQELHCWPDVTVPFVTVVRDELWLLAQKELGPKRQPVVSRSKDGRGWTEFEAMIPWEAVGSCTSPVMAPWEDGWILLCVVETW